MSNHPIHPPADRSARTAGADRSDRGVAATVGAVRSAADSPADPSTSGTEPLVLAGIPAYNEAGSIARVVRGAAPHVDEVVVVDDGSDDATARLARRAGATVVRHDGNRGYGATLGTLFEHAARLDAAHLVVLDGDGQHDPDDVPRLVAAQRETGADLVVGSRFLEGAGSDVPRYRRVGLSVVNALTNAGLRFRYAASGLTDTQSGFRAYNRAAVRSIADSGTIGEGMGASLDLLFHAAREDLAVAEVPATIDYDVDAPSSTNPVLHGLELLWAIGRETLPRPGARAGAGVVVAATALGSAVGLLGLFGGAVTRALLVVVFAVGAGIGLAASTVARAMLSLATGTRGDRDRDG